MAVIPVACVGLTLTAEGRAMLLLAPVSMGILGILSLLAPVTLQVSQNGVTVEILVLNIGKI